MRGHIRERAPGRWAVKIYVGRDPLTGKKLDRWFVVKGKGPGGKATKREAQVRAAELIAELKHEGFADPTKITVADVTGAKVRATLHFRDSQGFRILIRSGHGRMFTRY